MALKTNELFSSTTRAATKRIHPRVQKVKEFAEGSGTLVAGTLVAYDTVSNNWKPWTNGGANGTGTMKGILWPDDITLDAADQQLAQVMLRGRVHRDDVELNGETQGNVDAELRTGARDIGIDVEGLTQVR